MKLLASPRLLGGRLDGGRDDLAVGSVVTDGVATVSVYAELRRNLPLLPGSDEQVLNGGVLADQLNGAVGQSFAVARHWRQRSLVNHLI